MTQTPDPGIASGTADLAKPPATVTVGVVFTAVLGVVGLVGGLIAVAMRLPRVTDDPLRFLLTDHTVLLLALTAVAAAVVVAAALALRGASTARLGILAVLGFAVAEATAIALGRLAVVVYGIDDPYDEVWRNELFFMWAYLIPALLLAVPIVLLNRRGSARWFRDRRTARFPTVDTTPRPSMMDYARLALVGLGVLLLIAEVWAIQSLLTRQLGPESDLAEGLVRHFATTLVPLLLVIVAVVELNAASGLGQFATFAAAGYAVYRGLSWLPVESIALVSGDLTTLRVGPWLTALATLGVGGLLLVLLLHPATVRYLDVHRFRTDPGALFAEIDENDLDDELDDAETEPSPSRA